MLLIVLGEEKIGKSNTDKVLQDIIEALEAEPKSIQEVADQTGCDRATVSKYLNILAETGLIKQQKVGRQKMYWRYLMSDRQSGLELRGIAYQLGKLEENLEKSRNQIEKLITKSADKPEILEAEGET